MNTLTRFGLAAGLAGALALFGSAHAQQDTKEGPPGSGTGSGAPEGVGQGDTGRTGTSPSSGDTRDSSGDKMGAQTNQGSTTQGSDSASGGAGASASASGTAAGAPSAGKKLDKGLQDKLEKIHAANQAEIQMAQLGSTNAQSPDVKQFAEKMQTDHQTMDQKLTEQAQTMGVSLEGKTFQKEQQSATKEIQKLQSKTGQDFDKAFMSRMVKDHQKDAKEVKSAAKDAQKQKQPELASMLQQAETEVQGHLTHAKQVEKSLKGQRQGRRPSSSSSAEPSGSTGSSESGTPSEPAPGKSESQGTSGSQTGQTPSDTGSSSSHSTH